MSDAIQRLNAALEGRYAIERELGEGGMATVYLADDLKHERKVALKVLKPELAAVVGAERFLAEIKTTANLTHPHILPLFDSGEAEGRVATWSISLERCGCGIRNGVILLSRSTADTDRTDDLPVLLQRNATSKNHDLAVVGSVDSKELIAGL